jgi:hypothetical protein
MGIRGRLQLFSLQHTGCCFAQSWKSRFRQISDQINRTFSEELQLETQHIEKSQAGQIFP